jgi:hypothetical protein
MSDVLMSDVRIMRANRTGFADCGVGKRRWLLIGCKYSQPRKEYAA